MAMAPRSLVARGAPIARGPFEQIEAAILSTHRKD
jgi:hypothetical protein